MSKWLSTPECVGCSRGRRPPCPRAPSPSALGLWPSAPEKVWGPSAPPAPLSACWASCTSLLVGGCSVRLEGVSARRAGAQNRAAGGPHTDGSALQAGLLPVPEPGLLPVPHTPGSPERAGSGLCRLSHRLLSGGKYRSKLLFLVFSFPNGCQGFEWRPEDFVVSSIHHASVHGWACGCVSARQGAAGF